MLPAPRRPTELPPRVRVVVVFGGRSAEHDVSRLSAANVMAALDPERYEVVPIGIDRDGTWLLAAGHAADALPAGDDAGLGGLRVAGPPVDALPELQARRADDLPVVVLPVLHGPNGEDGTIQGLLELADVAYVGTGVLGSSVSMDKAMAKTVLGAAGIPQARYRVAREWELLDPATATDVLDDIADDLGFPIFVKPANMGSSVGVSRAVDRDALDRAVADALDHDEIVVFEEAIVGRELEIGVLGNEFPRASVPGEIVPAAEFYDYDDKYRDGAARTIVPADLSPGAVAEMSELALATYRALRAEGLARVDMFYDEGGRGFVVNEINTFPGFTPISMFPMMWGASGLSYGDLLDEMIRLALDRHARRRRRR
ncbi:MAG: D-alanine--D-alanine ligase family protein [Acidimicrobiales bacterium]